VDTATTSSGAGPDQAAPPRCGMLMPLPACWNNATLPPPVRQAQAVSTALGMLTLAHSDVQRRGPLRRRAGCCFSALVRRWPRRANFPTSASSSRTSSQASAGSRSTAGSVGPVARSRCGRCYTQRLGGEPRARHRSARARAPRRAVDDEHRPWRRGSVPRAAKACEPSRTEWERPERRYGCSRALELRGRGDAREVPRDAWVRAIAWWTAAVSLPMTKAYVDPRTRRLDDHRLD
jgi:hypothetical protein